MGPPVPGELLIPTSALAQTRADRLGLGIALRRLRLGSRVRIGLGLRVQLGLLIPLVGPSLSFRHLPADVNLI
jgi:hypothetical protein